MTTFLQHTFFRISHDFSIIYFFHWIVLQFRMNKLADKPHINHIFIKSKNLKNLYILVLQLYHLFYFQYQNKAFIHRFLLIKTPQLKLLFQLMLLLLTYSAQFHKVRQNLWSISSVLGTALITVITLRSWFSSILHFLLTHGI